MKKKNLILMSIAVVVVIGLVYAFSKQSKSIVKVDEPMSVMQFNEKETEIYKLTLDELLGYEFNDLSNVELHINLIHNGQKMEELDYTEFKDSDRLKKIYVGFKKDDNVFYDIVLKTDSSLMSVLETLVNDVELEKPESMSKYVYLPEKLDNKQNVVVLGAVCLSTQGAANLEEESVKIFDTSNISSMEEVYNRMKDKAGFEYCYVIELHQK